MSILHDIFGGLDIPESDEVFAGDSHTDILGGSIDTFHNSQMVDHATPNVFGGMDHHDLSGQISYSTSPNVSGGVDTFHNGQMVDHATPNVFGGMDHHDPSGQISYSTRPNIFGTADFHSKFFK